MNTKTIAVFLWLAVAAIAAGPELRPATVPLPDYPAHRAAGPIVVDGDLSDAAWANAAVATLGFPWPKQTGGVMPPGF